MNQALITVIIVLGLGSYYLYTQNETLKENNTKLEYAVAEQQAAMEALRESYEKQGKSLLNMSRRNAEIEQEKDEYLAIFSRHNLDLLALKKAGLIENRFNKGSEDVMETMEDETEELYKTLLCLTLIISGCSLIPERGIKIESKPIEIEIMQPDLPRPVQLTAPKWFVVSEAKIVNPCRATISFDPKKFDENGVEKLKRPKTCEKEDRENPD